MAGFHPSAYMEVLAATRKNESPYEPFLLLAFYFLRVLLISKSQSESHWYDIADGFQTSNFA